MARFPRRLEFAHACDQGLPSHLDFQCLLQLAEIGFLQHGLVVLILSALDGLRDPLDVVDETLGCCGTRDCVKCLRWGPPSSACASSTREGKCGVGCERVSHGLAGMLSK